SGCTNLALGFSERLALFKRQEFSERILVVEYGIMQLAQQFGALQRRRLAKARKCSFGSLDRAACLSLARLRNCTQRLTGSRVDHVDRRAAVRLHPLTSDEVRLAHEVAGSFEHLLPS